MSLSIIGLGTAVPPDAVSPEDGLRIARYLAGPDVRTSDWLGPIYANSGIRQRFQVIGGHVVRDLWAGTNVSGSPFLPSASNDGLGPTTGERMDIYAEEVGPMAFRAASSALENSGAESDSITHLVTVSCTGFMAPGIDLSLIRSLGLLPTVERTHVGFMGCHGALNGLRVANAFATAYPDARVLICAAELPSLHYYYGSSADKLVANAIFADGAAALVGQRAQTSGPESVDGSDKRKNHWRVSATGSCVIPDSAADMGWVIGDHGFEMSLSRRVPGLIAQNLRPWLQRWLGKHSLTVESVGSWAIHPGGPKILAAVEEALNLPSEALMTSKAIYSEYGNMSSPTVLFVIDRLLRQGGSLPCVAMGFGPGLVVEAVIFDS